jgi:hypothetical protein
MCAEITVVSRCRGGLAPAVSFRRWSGGQFCEVVPGAVCGDERIPALPGGGPDFCEAADPESKGIVEHLVGYAERDLIVPASPVVGDLVAPNRSAAAWCAEVNAAVHSEICAVPAQRLEQERELLAGLPSLRPEIAATVAEKGTATVSGGTYATNSQQCAPWRDERATPPGTAYQEGQMSAWLRTGPLVYACE